jgi:hypothetical protein
MSKPAPDFDLLRLFDALRPRDFRVQIVAPDGSITHDAKFATKSEAKIWANANRQPADVAITHRVDSSSKN